ncbi:MAG: hypothetical protein M1351_09620 [Candidatus Thermoplasmatota archaeon]|nr:hypothetical protein [Candidatus Sysuiplasma jiujiangense]MBX8639107.1 hypothetical protein [Candidatus Sysuiplasma jiujiangense]MBX8641440.1 hypothetical protein [Candidatus Sysuiplasma jiujiangense]MCL5254322.1 hypothetical protein [Candidatus Thermoplasmatota archaeon]
MKTLAEIEFGFVRPCTGNAYVVYPSTVYDLPLAKCASALKRKGIRVKPDDMMINVMYNGHSCTLYRTGRLLVTPCSSEEEALKTARGLFDLLVQDRKMTDSFKRAEAI